MPKKDTKKVRGHTCIGGMITIAGVKFHDPTKITHVKTHYRKKRKR